MQGAGVLRQPCLFIQLLTGCAGYLCNVSQMGCAGGCQGQERRPRLPPAGEQSAGNPRPAAAAKPTRHPEASRDQARVQLSFSALEQQRSSNSCIQASSPASQTLLSWFPDRRHHAQKHVDWQCLVHLLASHDPSVVSVTAASIASLARLIPSVVPAACAPLLTQHLGPAAAAFVASGPQRGPERLEAPSALQLDLGTLGYKLCAVVGCVRSVAAAA